MCFVKFLIDTYYREISTVITLMIIFLILLRTVIKTMLIYLNKNITYLKRGFESLYLEKQNISLK